MPTPIAAPAALLEGHAEPTSFVAATPDAAVAVSTSPDGTARLWRRGRGRAARVARLPSWTRGCGISADGRVAVVAGYDGGVCVWATGGDDAAAEGERRGQAREDEVFRFVRGGGFEHSNGVAITPDARWCAATFYRHNRLGGELVVMELGRRRDGDARIGVLSKTVLGSMLHLREVAISSDGAIAAVSCWNGGDSWHVAVVDARTGETVPSMRTLRGVVALPPLTTGRAAGGSAASTAAGMSLAGTLPGIALSADGGWLAAADGQALRVWSVAGGSRPSVACAGYEPSKGHFVAMTPGAERVVASVAGGEFRVWDARSGVALVRLHGHSAMARGCAVSVCGTRFWTCSTDTRVGYWELPEDMLPRLEARRVTDDDARAWFKAAVGYARRTPGLPYSVAGTALRALLHSGGHLSRVQSISADEMEEVFEGLDIDGRERLVEPEFVSAVRIVLRRLGISRGMELSHDWWEKFENAADWMSGCLSQRQAMRLALKLAAKERGLVGIAPRSTEVDRALVSAMFARSDGESSGDGIVAEDTGSMSEGRTTRLPSNAVRVSLFIDVGMQLMRGASADTAWAVDDNAEVPVPACDANEVENNNGNDTLSQDAEMICVICQNDFALGDTLVRVPCMHELHRSCLLQYLRSSSDGAREASCPICRTFIPSQARDDIDVLPQRRFI